MRRPIALLLAGLLLAVPAAPASSAPTAVTAPGAEAFSLSLRDALHTGEWANVRRHFHATNDPALGYLAARWDDMREGRLDPEAWEVRFEPYFGDADGATGQLSIAARQASGPRVGRRFDVSLLRRGGVWLVGEAVRYDKPETRIVRHDLTVDLRRAGELQAMDALTLEATGPDRHVYMRLHPALRAESLSFGGRDLPFVQANEVIHFERPDAPGPCVVTLRYGGKLPASDWDFVRGSGAVLRSEFLWYPRPAVGGSFTPYRVAVKVEPGFQAIAVGAATGTEREAGAWTYGYETERPVEGMSVYTGRYEKLEAMAGPVALATYTAVGRGEARARFLAEAARVLDFYGEHFGPYPYGKLAIVETGFPGGYGATTALALPSLAFDSPKVADEFLAHEIAHNWTDRVSYGGTLGERGFMAEGVASYMDLLYHLGRDGVPAFRRRLQDAQRRYDALLGTSRDVALAEANQDDRPTWQALTYDKAAIVLHMLRREVGDKAFDAGLKALYTAHAGQAVTLATFEAAFSRSAGKHMGYFFRQWVSRPGVPVFETEKLAVKAVGGGKYEVTGLLAQRNLPFVLTVPLVVVSDAGQTLYQVPVKSLQTPFRLSVKGKPRALMIDPLRDVLLQAEGPIALN